MSEDQERLYFIRHWLVLEMELANISTGPQCAARLQWFLEADLQDLRDHCAE